MITSDDLAFFAVLADSASLAEAARKLNVTPPAVSQRLQALEARAGVRLIDRTGRRTSLTDEGALVAAHGRQVAQTMEALTEALGDRTRKVSGHLRVTAPHGFGRLHVAPVAEAFAREHEGVTISLELSDHPGAGLIDSCDLAVHIGPPGPLNQVVTTLAPNRRILCASPDYLAQNEAVNRPDDLLRIPAMLRSVSSGLSSVSAAHSRRIAVEPVCRTACQKSSVWGWATRSVFHGQPGA